LDAAARQISGSALTMYMRGQTSTVERWLASFDQAAFERRPPLAVSAAWIHILSGRAGQAERMADIADRGDHHGRPGDGSASFASQRAMLRAVMARNGPRDARTTAPRRPCPTRSSSTVPPAAWRVTAKACASTAAPPRRSATPITRAARSATSSPTTGTTPPPAGR
jgi:ATP/maltotriose-dependent transcriptional regulator MalT